MLTAEAHVTTERPSRYLVQLCRHVDQIGQHVGHQPRAHKSGAPPEMRQVEWSDTYGIVRLDWGQWTMRATTDTLTLRAEAADTESLQRIQELVAGRLEKIGRRDHLTVEWQPPQQTPDQPAEPATTAPTPETPERHAHRGRRRSIVLIAAGALAVTIHFVLGGAVLTQLRWSGWATDTVLAVILIVIIVKVGALGTIAIRRRKARAR